jgi:phosphoserine aminotransferase
MPTLFLVWRLAFVLEWLGSQSLLKWLVAQDLLQWMGAEGLLERLVTQNRDRAHLLLPVASRENHQRQEISLPRWMVNLKTPTSYLIRL